MTRLDVAVLSFRILAVYFLFRILQGLAQLVGILTTTWTDPYPVGAWSVPLALSAVLGVLLFWKAPAIARTIFPGQEPMSTANRPEIGALALKVCGILLFADCLAHTGQLLDSRLPPAQHVTSMLLLGVSAALLFFLAPPLSRRLFGAPVKPMTAPLLGHVQAVTFSVVGIWLLVTSMSSLADSVRDRVLFDGWSRGVWSQIAAAALGLLLFLGGGGLSAFWYWMRHAGLTARAR